jgi:RNase adaptor protein for sRNA GlmZ degradation
MVKKHKIVIIRGKVTAGKSTTSYNLAKVLPDWIFIDPWKIKEMFEPLELNKRNYLRTISKKAMLTIIREVIRQMKINIILQESTRGFIRKYLAKDLKKYNYEVYSFFLDVDLKDAIKRDKQREKPTMRIGKNVKTNEEWKRIKAQPEKGDIIIDTSKLNEEQVLDFILKTIKERKKKHPRGHLIKRSW